MLYRDLVIIGGGPAGLTAAKIASESGLEILLIDRNPQLGGQLIKQTHMFFGSEAQHAKTRGIDIAVNLINEVLNSDLIEVWQNATAVGLYKDNVVTIFKKEDNENKYIRVRAKAFIIATGASEKVLAFENNDLPGIFGAGAVQTLMNVYGVKPGNNILMVGSGNIGLIVSYQLLQAGVNVVGVIEAAPTIGGYKVHASKLRRLGVPIYTSRTIKKAVGETEVSKAITIALDNKWNNIPDSEVEFEVDGICIAVGLTPLSQLMAMVGCEMKYVSELGGLIPVIKNHQTSIPSIFACGDVVGIEEASSAIVEGYLTGLHAASSLGMPHPQHETLVKEYQDQLRNLRSGPFGEKIRKGLKIMEGSNVI